MRYISYIRPGALLQEVELPNEGPIIETRVKRRRGDVLLGNIGRQVWNLLGQHVLGEVDITDDTVNYLWLCHSNLNVVLLLYVDSKVILYVFLIFNV